MSEKVSVRPLGLAQRGPAAPNKSEHSKAREPVRRTTGRVVGRYPSLKNKRMISWESQLEQKACALFEFSPGVLYYREQPAKICFQHQGKELKYTPDFCIELFGCRKVYIEVKPSKLLDDPTYLLRLNDISDALAQQKIGFGVLTEKELNNPVLQSNLRLLRQPLQIKLTETVLKNTCRYFLNRANATVREFADAVGGLELVYALIAQQYLDVDLYAPVLPNSILSAKEWGCYESFLFKCRYSPDFE